jgi:cardiolipin synthase
MWQTLIQYYTPLVVAFYALCLFVVATMIYEERDPSTTLAWVVVFIALPPLGLVLFMLIGRDPAFGSAHDKRHIRAAASGRKAITPLYRRFADQSAALTDGGPPIVGSLVRAIRSMSGTEPLPCTDPTIYANGGEMFDRLYRDIQTATDHVHLEYYTWEDDQLTRRFCDLLAEKVRAGVEVRILYDWVGSIRYGKTQLRKLRKQGAQVRADAARLNRLDYRNHRKIALIDGRIAFTGGINFGQEYIDGGPRFASWRDTAVRFEGPLVWDLQRIFTSRWMRITGEELFSQRYFPEQEGPGQPGEWVWGQIAYSGAESRWESIHHAFLIAIGTANRRVRVQSPYFVPDQALADALVAQSFTGIGVELMMAGVPDKKIPWWAAFTYIDKLLDAGGAVLQYGAGFFHAKTMTIDGLVAVIGTANFDIRSFSLNDEVSLFFYDEGVTAAQDAIFENDMAACKTLTAAGVAALPRRIRFRNALARLVSRLL